jgi:tRNA G18 (ribose-2'-O)-methylase SpoU
MNHEASWRGAVELIRRAATRKGREVGGFFSIEGIRLHERALRAGVQVEQAIVAQGIQSQPSSRLRTLLNDLRQSNCQLVDVPPALIEELTGGRELGPILGLVKMPEQPRLADVLKRNEEAPAVLGSWQCWRLIAHGTCLWGDSVCDYRDQRSFPSPGLAHDDG